ncbi:MAG: hydantoinase/oxoprolinase family protein, partial [Pseudomonadota bacterium]
GDPYFAKVPSTPKQPDVGALNAIEAASLDLASIDDLVHGSTVATNAVLERKGGRVAAFVTKGTRDIFGLQRQDRLAIYDLHYQKPVPVVERCDVHEITERLAPDGSVVVAMDEARTREALAELLRSEDYDAVAVCLLHSYANPEHERTISAIIRELAPELPVTCSSDVSPEFREYERATTTTLAAYVQPVISGYLDRLVAKLGDGNFDGRFSIMQSNGGRMPATAMGRNAIAALFSGPAAGVVGAIGTAARSGIKDIITFDMGGTSTDVALIAGGQPHLAPQTVIDGLPVRTPVIDIATVGAGGGSIAWADDGGLLRVGPQSAGATPGPACYGRGGEQPTVTDAHLIRGTLQAGSFLGGTMEVHEAASRQAFEPLAGHFGVSVEEAADNTIRIAENNIVRAIEQVSTEQGLDPRDFVLVPFGGAGPLHAARIAEELEIDTFLVPVNAGVLSAAGLLMADHVHYRSHTRRTRLDESAVRTVKSILSALADEAVGYLEQAGVKGETRFEYVLEMRYVGQAFELSVPIGIALDELTFSYLEETFRNVHHRVFEFSKPPDKPAEIVSFRVGVHARTDTFPTTVATAKGTQTRVDSGRTERTIDIVEGGEKFGCRVLSRRAISETEIAGTLLIEDGTSTLYVPTGWKVRCDASGNLIVQREGR